VIAPRAARRRHGTRATSPMLEAAARHEEIRAEDVMALAAAWQPAVDDAALAQVHARALELGVRDGAARAQAMREQVLDELALLLARAEGELPRAPAASVRRDAAARAREGEIARIKASLAAFDADRVGSVAGIRWPPGNAGWCCAPPGSAPRRAPGVPRWRRCGAIERARFACGAIAAPSRTFTDRAPRGPRT
jgi:hypothetical protein